MTFTSLQQDYLGGGLAAALPAAATLGPTIPPGSCAFYFATDSNVLYRLAGGDTAWQVAAGGGGGDFTKIASHTCGAAETTVSFGSIPNTFSCLKIIGQAGSVTAGSVDPMTMEINGDATGGHYLYTMLGSFASGTGFGDTRGIAFLSNTGAGAPKGSFEISIPDYATADPRMMHCNGAAYQPGVNPVQFECAEYYSQAAVVASLGFALSTGAAFTTGSKFLLYGLA
jgi:hypothetical protein